MNEIYFKFKLKSKKSHDKQIILCASLYNEKNGIMQFPIDLAEWEVISILRYIGRKDIQNRRIFEDDNVRFKSLVYNRVFEGLIRYNNSSCSFYIEGTNGNSFSLNAEIIDLEIINESVL